MRRHILGIIALLFLSAWIAGLTYAAPGDARTRMLASVCMRTGLVLGALWLALPQVTVLLSKYPLWLIGTVCAMVMAVVYRPRLFVPVLLALLALHFLGWLLKPLQTEPRPGREAGEQNSGQRRKG